MAVQLREIADSSKQRDSFPSAVELLKFLRSMGISVEYLIDEEKIHAQERTNPTAVGTEVVGLSYIDGEDL